MRRSASSNIVIKLHPRKSPMFPPISPEILNVMTQQSVSFSAPIVFPFRYLFQIYPHFDMTMFGWSKNEKIQQNASEIRNAWY